MNHESLIQFLLESNAAGYAGGEAKKWIKETDGSTTIPFTQGQWRSNDNFFGGEPYGGRLAAFFEDKPVWLMVYYGYVDESADTNKIYEVLREALKRMPKEAPFRGPARLEKGEFIYINTLTGNVEKYSGEEQITLNKVVVYRANYMGGLIDQRIGD